MCRSCANETWMLLWCQGWTPQEQILWVTFRLFRSLLGVKSRFVFKDVCRYSCSFKIRHFRLFLSRCF